MEREENVMQTSGNKRSSWVLVRVFKKEIQDTQMWLEAHVESKEGLCLFVFMMETQRCISNSKNDPAYREKLMM